MSIKKGLPLFLLVFCIFSILGFMGAINTKAAGANLVNAWSPPAGTAQNNTFTVQVKPYDESTWRDLHEYNVKVGHQDGTNFNSSMVNFDFSGSVDVKVTYNSGTISSYDIRPTSYGISATQSGNTLTFSIAQNDSSPRKIVLRINNSWDTGNLHIVTNPLETNVPSETSSNVFLINPGDDIPLQLPAGKDTYYFKPGLHTLSKGSWVEIDLGATYSIDKIDLDQATFELLGLGSPVTYPNKFLVETKVNLSDAYTTAYDGTNNTSTGYITKIFSQRNARYVRLKLLGSNVSSGWIFSNSIKEFKVYQVGGSTNLALNRAIAGAMPSYTKAVDGDSSTLYASSTSYGNWHSGESFFISKSNITVYIAGGAVVQGSIISDEVNNVTIRGRGILDGSQLQHTNPTPGEARTGSVWLISGSDNLLEGITIIDPPMWSVVMNFSTRPVVKNINLFGYAVNADGIHFSGSKDGTITGVFIRTPDDNIVMYHYGPGSFNTVENSVFWGDDAHIILLGLGSVPNATISDITIQNSDVLTQQGVYDVTKFTGVFKLWANGQNIIKNILFKDIRIEEFRDPSKAAVFEFRTDARFTGDGNGKLIQNITLDNIAYNGSGEQQSLLKGVDSSSYVQDIYINKYLRQGSLVTDAGSGNINIQNNVNNVDISNSKSLLENNFDSGSTGSAPSGWTSDSGITVQPVPSASDKSVRMSKTGSGAIVVSKPITASSGIVIVQAKVNISDKTNWKSLRIDNSSGTELMQVGFDSGGNIYSNNGTIWTSFMPYNINQWYNIIVVINTITDKYDLYIAAETYTATTVF